MATLLLQAAGTALGSALGGPVGGMIGSAIGAVAGAAIDSTWLNRAGGNSHREGPRLKEMNGLAATEGAAIPRLFGRARLGGQLIWATRFEEEVQVSVARTKAGAKGGKSQKSYDTTYAYYANLAIGLCEGEIAFLRRIWVDGRELDVSTVTMRVHTGREDQEPDPLIAAKEAGEAPAYRGLAYVVFERLALADYGNRVPQFSFEVVRRVPGLGDMIRAANLIPGAGEFVYETRWVSHEPEPGVSETLSRHQLYGGSDVETALMHLRALCPALQRINLVVTWFGDDLHAGRCTLTPRVEISHKPTVGAEWSVAGLGRAVARPVSQIDGKPAFGGTPSDDSVITLIRKLRDEYGLEVVLYPFVMMDIPSDNALSDPTTGAASQPRYPWRGRITSPSDGTSLAVDHVTAFLGTVTPRDMTVSQSGVTCSKPDEWSYRRMVLHMAALAQAAGGVHGFIIGSELIGLTRLRSGAGYPMAAGLVALAQDVRAMLPSAMLTYAADWTEYGAHVRNGGRDVAFPLDPLWASSAIDAIGIDWYPPLSDWRDDAGYADAEGGSGTVDVEDLRAQLTGGEAFDWYYADAADRAARIRRPISDGAYGKPWVFRQKDLAGWWMNPHVERVDGVETQATAFGPGTKPIWLTEIGIPAVDKGTNAPNVFPDDKSSESAFPHFSSGARDDLVQARGLQAILSGFDPALPGFEAARNPVHPATGVRMIDEASIAVWAWDARPFPAFPDLASAWADGVQFETGHWVNGRLEGTPVDRLISTILAEFGLPDPDAIEVDGFLDGYVIERPMSARQALEPLAQIFGFDATMAGGRLLFRGRGGQVAAVLTADDLVLDRDSEPFRLRRAQESELPRELRLSFSDGQADYRAAASRSRRLAGVARSEISIETAVVTREAEARRLADRRLQEIWAGRDTIEFDMSPRRLAIEPGDVVSLAALGATRLFRITRIDDAATRRVSARAVEPAIYHGAAPAAVPHPPRDLPSLPGRPFVVPLHLPIARGQPPALLSLAGAASPWPGALMIWRAGLDGQFQPFRVLDSP